MTGDALGTLFHSLLKMLPSAVTASGLGDSSAADTGLDTCGEAAEAAQTAKVRQAAGEQLLRKFCIFPAKLQHEVQHLGEGQAQPGLQANGRERISQSIQLCICMHRLPTGCCARIRSGAHLHWHQVQ